MNRGFFLLLVEEARWNEGERLGDPKEREAMPDVISWEAERRIRRREADDRGGWRAWIASFILLQFMVLRSLQDVVIYRQSSARRRPW